MAEQDLKDKCECEVDEEEDGIVELEDEDGNLIKFHHITTMEHNDKEYVFLQAVDGDDDAVLEIFELDSDEQDGEMYDLLNPVDDDLYDVLYARLMKEIEEHAGCDCEDGECDCDEEGCNCHHE